jgi:PKHD-type hydroxylase
MVKFKPAFISTEPLLTQAECNELIAAFEAKSPRSSKVGNEVVNYRKSEGMVLDPLEQKRVYEKIEAYARDINQAHWGYDLKSLGKLQFIRYAIGGHYDWHLDIGSGHNQLRKLSLVILISPESDFEGGNLIIKNSAQDTTIPLKQGHAVLFPSFMLHKVEPVIQGFRYVLVGWLVGDRPFR